MQLSTRLQCFSPPRNENLSFKNRPWNANCSENDTSCCVGHSCWLGRRFFFCALGFTLFFVSCFPPLFFISFMFPFLPLSLHFHLHHFPSLRRASFFCLLFHFFPHSLSPLLSRCLLAAVCDAYYGVMLGHHATHTHTHTHTPTRRQCLL